MLTTPIVARFHSSAASSSATDTLKLARSRSFKLRTTWRLSLIDCAASMWSSRVRKAIMQWSVASGQWPEKLPFDWPLITDHWALFLSDYFRGNPLGHKGLDHVADFDVAVVGDRDAALHAVGDLFGVVFKAPQGSYFTFED